MKSLFPNCFRSSGRFEKEMLLASPGRLPPPLTADQREDHMHQRVSDPDLTLVPGFKPISGRASNKICGRTSSNS